MSIPALSSPARKVMTVARKSLRPVHFAAGMKILMFCDNKKDQPGSVTEVLPAGRGVMAKCDAGDQIPKEQPLASLRSKAELLPPSKTP